MARLRIPLSRRTARSQAARVPCARIRPMRSTPVKATRKTQQVLFAETDMLSGLVWAVVVGLIAGWLAGKVMKGRGYGVLTDLALGIVGGVIGRFVFGVL